MIVIMLLCIWDKATRGNIFLDYETTSQTDMAQEFCYFHSPVTTYCVTFQKNLHQTWEWAFTVLQDKMVIKYPPDHGQINAHEEALPTGKCRLLCASAKIKLGAAATADFEHPLKRVHGRNQE